MIDTVQLKEIIFNFNEIKTVQAYLYSRERERERGIERQRLQG